MQSKVGFDYSVGSIHESNHCGRFIITEDMGREYGYNLFRIRFELTGYEMTAYAHNLRNGEVKDPYYPNICGIACMGVLNVPYSVYGRDHNRWSSMIHRCYNPKHSRYPLYGALGIRVCDRWLCFQYYYEDMEFIPGRKEYLRDPDNYQLDKDILQEALPKSQMIYSPQTCMFVPKRLNILYGVGKKSKFGYHGIKQIAENKFAVYLKHNGAYRYAGVYATPELAAGAYNCFVSYCYPYMPLNNVRTLTPYEMTELDLRRKVDMVTYV